MLRHTLLPFALLLGLLAPSATIAQGTCVLSADFEGGMPAGWDLGAQVEQQDGLGNGLGTFVDAWRTGTSSEANTNGWFPVPDAPTGNLFAMANDDAAPCNCAMADVALTSPAFDLSASQNTALRFRAFTDGIFWGGSGLVEATTDGTTWTNVGTIVPVPHRWQRLMIDLSDFDGEPVVRVRFRWSDNGNWAGGLAIDDICVAPRQPHDLVVLDAFLSDAEADAYNAALRTLPYTQLPLEQADTLLVKLVVLNAGTLAAISPAYTAAISVDGNAQGSFTENRTVLGAGETDTVLIHTAWLPGTTGRIEAAISVAALSTDDVPADNDTTLGLWITGNGVDLGNNAMALDDSVVTGAIANGGNDFAVAVRYEITRSGSAAHAVGFLPGSGSVANGRLVAKVLDDQFSLLATSAEHVLTQVEIDDALTQGRMVYLPFSTPLALDGNADVYAVIEHESDSGAVTVALANGAVRGSALFYDGPGIQWNNLLNVPIVRLYLGGPEVGLNEQVNGTGLTVAPVPCDQETWLWCDGPSTSPVVWSLVDLMGRTVRSGVARTDRERIPTADLPTGPYTVVTERDGVRQVLRVLVVH
ncbi:MAG: hypothetical protein JNL05_02970 [Flavobacteriales bacterium]|nr:hypothetical protein [Flavobacteriales bacterium]